MSTGVRTFHGRRWARRFGASVLVAYVLSLIGVAVHFALIDHTIDGCTGQAVGLHGHDHDHGETPVTGARFTPHSDDDHAGPTHCHFAEHLAGSAAVDSRESGAAEAIVAATLSAPPATPVRPGGPLLLSAPKHSPPA